MIYEIRTYTLKPGAVSEFEKRLAACMSSEVGRLNVWVHIWPYASLEERDRIRVESFKLDTWPPKTREFMISMENKFMIPASFSPMA